MRSKVMKSGGGGGQIGSSVCVWGELDQKSGGGANWPKVVGLFLVLVQGEKCPPPNLSLESVCVCVGGGMTPVLWPHPFLRPCTS